VRNVEIALALVCRLKGAHPGRLPQATAVAEGRLEACAALMRETARALVLGGEPEASDKLRQALAWLQRSAGLSGRGLPPSTLRPPHRGLWRALRRGDLLLVALHAYLPSRVALEGVYVDPLNEGEAAANVGELLVVLEHLRVAHPLCAADLCGDGAAAQETGGADERRQDEMTAMLVVELHERLRGESYSSRAVAHLQARRAAELAEPPAEESRAELYNYLTPLGELEAELDHGGRSPRVTVDLALDDAGFVQQQHAPALVSDALAGSLSVQERPPLSQLEQLEVRQGGDDPYDAVNGGYRCREGETSETGEPEQTRQRMIEAVAERERGLMEAEALRVLAAQAERREPRRQQDIARAQTAARQQRHPPAPQERVIHHPHRQPPPPPPEEEEEQQQLQQRPATAVSATKVMQARLFFKSRPVVLVLPADSDYGLQEPGARGNASPATRARARAKRGEEPVPQLWTLVGTEMRFISAEPHAPPRRDGYLVLSDVGEVRFVRGEEEGELGGADGVLLRFKPDRAGRVRFASNGLFARQILLRSTSPMSLFVHLGVLVADLEL
jgi:hypothetical protein